jgi:hypothetical protein
MSSSPLCGASNQGAVAQQDEAFHLLLAMPGCRWSSLRRRERMLGCVSAINYLVGEMIIAWGR